MCHLRNSNIPHTDLPHADLLRADLPHTDVSVPEAKVGTLASRYER